MICELCFRVLYVVATILWKSLSNVCYFVIIISSFFVLSLKSTNIIFSFLSFSFHFECVGWCIELPFCSYVFCWFFFFLVAFIQTLCSVHNYSFWSFFLMYVSGKRILFLLCCHCVPYIFPLFLAVGLTFTFKVLSLLSSLLNFHCSLYYFYT